MSYGWAGWSGKQKTKTLQSKSGLTNCTFICFKTPLWSTARQYGDVFSIFNIKTQSYLINCLHLSVYVTGESPTWSHSFYRYYHLLGCVILMLCSHSTHCHGGRSHTHKSPSKAGRGGDCLKTSMTYKISPVRLMEDGNECTEGKLAPFIHIYSIYG